MYFIAFATVNWIDIFIREEYKEIIVDCLKYCQEKKGLEIYAWCLMTSHVHLVIGSKTNTLEEIVRDLKRHTSSGLRKLISNNSKESRKEWIMWMMERAGKKNGNNLEWQFWQQHNKPLIIQDQQMFDSVLEYIHLNPVVEGFVNQPEEWKYSSAINFCNMNGLIALNHS